MAKVSAMIGRMKPFVWRGGIPLLMLLLSACSSVISTRVNTFRAPEDLAARGTIAVEALHADLNRSLEFAW